MAKICFPPHSNDNCHEIDYRQPDGPPHPGELWKLLKPDDIINANTHLKDLIANGILDKQKIVDVAYLGLITKLTDGLSLELKNRFQRALTTSLSQINRQKKYAVKL